MTDQTIEWLRGLAEQGGKGVVNNIDARCLGRIADRLEYLQSTEANEILRLRDELDRARSLLTLMLHTEMVPPAERGCES